ncbi:MAG: hypothetical protein ACE5G0_20490, partial [Rhodothermales bacterium]
GSVTFEECISSLSELVQTLQAKQYTRAVIDLRSLTLDMKLGQPFEFGKIISSTPALWSTKVALVVPREEDDCEFIETVARNRGFSAAYFLDMHEACEGVTQTV